VLKILLLIVILFVVVMAFRAYKRVQSRPESPPAPADQVETMVRCAHCGVNLPRSEAILSQGDFYCCPEHQQHGRQ